MVVPALPFHRQQIKRPPKEKVVARRKPVQVVINPILYALAIRLNIAEEVLMRISVSLRSSVDARRKHSPVQVREQDICLYTSLE